jgi:ABC-type sugar transport system permease subunit
MQSESVEKTKKSARPRPLHQARYKRLWGLLLISPWLIGLAIFKLIPILASLWLSFTNFFLLTPHEARFVGFKNYISIFTDPNVSKVLLRTINLALIIIPVQLCASVFMAALLSSDRLKMKNALRMLFFLPSIIPSVAATYMWRGFVNTKTGWLYTLILNPLGLSHLINLSSRNSGQTLFVLSSLWALGPGMLIIIAAMQGIPSEVREAALVDGASRLRRFFSITIPMVSPAIFFTLILNLTAVFGGAILLDRGHTFNSNMSSFDSYVYYILFTTFRLGSAAALAWVFFIFVIILVLILFRTSKYWVYFPDSDN